MLFPYCTVFRNYNPSGLRLPLAIPSDIVGENAGTVTMLCQKLTGFVVGLCAAIIFRAKLNEGKYYGMLSRRFVKVYRFQAQWQVASDGLDAEFDGCPITLAEIHWFLN